jgi:hypothetical protein
MWRRGLRGRRRLGQGGGGQVGGQAGTPGRQLQMSDGNLQGLYINECRTWRSQNLHSRMPGIPLCLGVSGAKRPRNNFD